MAALAPSMALSPSSHSSLSPSSSANGSDGKTIPIVPFGALTSIPEPFNSLDQVLVDQLLVACDMGHISPLAGVAGRTSPIFPWQLIGEKDGCQMHYAKMPDSDNYLFKGVCIVPVGVKPLEDAIRVPANMKVIDPMCLETKTIRTFDRDHHIYYASFKLGFMIYNRDFSWFSVEANLPDGTYVTTGKSIIVDDCPAREKHVRGEIRASGYVVSPVPGRPDQARVAYVVQTDPKGWLPTKVVNIVAKSQAYNPGIIKQKASSFVASQLRAATSAAISNSNGSETKTASPSPSPESAALPSPTSPASAPLPSTSPLAAPLATSPNAAPAASGLKFVE